MVEGFTNYRYSCIISFIHGFIIFIKKLIVLSWLKFNINYEQKFLKTKCRTISKLDWMVTLHY